MEPGPDHPSSQAAPQGRLQNERVLRPHWGVQGQTTGPRKQACSPPPPFWPHRVLSGSPRPSYGQGAEGVTVPEA